MTRDANEIASQYERREQEGAPRWVGNQRVPSTDPGPKYGTLTVLSGFQGTSSVLAEMRNVTVMFTDAGLIIAEFRNGIKQAFKPVEGWCIMFEPNRPAPVHAGE